MPKAIISITCLTQAYTLYILYTHTRARAHTYSRYTRTTSFNNQIKNCIYYSARYWIHLTVPKKIVCLFWILFWCTKPVFAIDQLKLIYFCFFFYNLSVESIVATVRHSLKRHYWLVNHWISHSKHLSEFVWAKRFRRGFRIQVYQCTFQEASLLFIRLNEQVKNRREWKRASHINCDKWVSLTHIKYTLIAQIRWCTETIISININFFL